MDSRFICNTNYTAKTDTRMLQDGFLNSVREHFSYNTIFTLGHNDSLDATSNEQHTIFCDMANITSMNPPLTIGMNLDDLIGCFRFIVVTQHQSVTSKTDFTFLIVS